MFGICILTGDIGWQDRGVDVEKKGFHDRSLWDAILKVPHEKRLISTGTSKKSSFFGG